MPLISRVLGRFQLDKWSSLSWANSTVLYTSINSYYLSFILAICHAVSVSMMLLTMVLLFTPQLFLPICHSFLLFVTL